MGGSRPYLHPLLRLSFGSDSPIRTHFGVPCVPNGSTVLTPVVAAGIK
jgi:hypothetical protein